MGAWLLALLEDGHRNLTEPLADSGCSSSSCPRRIAQASPPAPPPTIRIPTSIRSSGGSVGTAIASIGPNGGGNSLGLAIECAQDQNPLAQILDRADILKASASRPLRLSISRSRL